MFYYRRHIKLHISFCAFWCKGPALWYQVFICSNDPLHMIHKPPSSHHLPPTSTHIISIRGQYIICLLSNVTQIFYRNSLMIHFNYRGMLNHFWYECVRDILMVNVSIHFVGIEKSLMLRRMKRQKIKMTEAYFHCVILMTL